MTDKPTLFITALGEEEFIRKMEATNPKFIIKNPRCWFCGRDNHEHHAGLLIDPIRKKIIPKIQQLVVEHQIIDTPDFTGHIKVGICQYCLALIKIIQDKDIRFLTV